MRKSKKKLDRTKEKVIVCDIDDTLMGFIDTLLFFYNKINGSCIYETDLTEWDFNIVRFKDANGKVVRGRDIKDFFHTMEPHGLYATLKPLPDAKHALDIFKKLNYRIILITARKNKYRQTTLLNLIYNDFPIDVNKDVYFDEDKVKRIKKLQEKYEIVAFVDDKLSTVNNVSSKCRVENVFLINMSSNKNKFTAEKVKRIDNVFEVVRYLKSN